MRRRPTIACLASVGKTFNTVALLSWCAFHSKSMYSASHAQRVVCHARCRLIATPGHHRRGLGPIPLVRFGPVRRSTCRSQPHSRGSDGLGCACHRAALRADVVICTYTLARWELFVRAVESVLAQTVAPQQLIIVVDHNDEVLARCRQEWGAGRADSPVEIVVVASQFAGQQASSRNTALLLARADIVSFLDDDAEAAPDWLERLLAVYATHPEAVAVGGAPRPDYGAPRPSWFPPEFEWVFGCHYRSLPDRLAPVRTPDRHEHERASRRHARCRRVPRRRLRRHGSLAPDRPRARAGRRPLRAARGGPSLRPSRAG